MRLLAALRLLPSLVRDTCAVLWDEYRTGTRTAAWLGRRAEDLRRWSP
jgi:hypothetical protein